MTKKIKVHSIYLLLTCSIILYSCSSSKDNSGIAPETGDYSFIFSDSAGAKLIEGTLTLKTVSGGKIDGSYKNTAVYDSSFSAYNLLRGGKFNGTYKPNGDLGFNMNPLLADNNVYIGAKVSGDNITGNWAQSTMTGTKAKGKFTAALK